MVKNKICALILPYFGEFNNYFSLFLKSVEYNPEYDLFLFTDNENKYNYPPNVKVIKTSLEKVKNIADQKLGFSVSLEKPYKLCDYKPAYGFLFEEFIQDYEYWGHCDCDLLFGDLTQILTPLLRQGYDKIFAAGHLTLYKNSYENNRRFMLPYGDMGQLYRTVFTNDKIFAFDEQYYNVNVHKIFEQEGCKIWTKDLSFNVATEEYNFYRKAFDGVSKWNIVDKKKRILYWFNGKAIAIHKEGDDLKFEEFIYIHLQSRKFKAFAKIENYDGLRITPIGFEAIRNIPETIKEFHKEKKVYITKDWLVYQVRKFKNLILKSKRTVADYNPYTIEK